MAEIVISIASKLAEYLVPPTISQGRYLFCGAKITRNLEFEKEELVQTRESVQQLVQEALNRTEIITKAVEKWLEEVENVLAEVENLEQELNAGNGCFRGWYPNWRKYSLSKEMAKKTDIMIKLNTNRHFNPFSFRARLPDIEYFSSGNFMYFKSTKLASDELLKALGDDSLQMIGLYGMGGSGKTTLAKEVGKKAKEAKLFDRVIFTTVSQTPNVKRIQQEIANLLDLKIDDYFDSEGEVARKISFRLQRGEPILLILDDVWAKLNLEDIGIPLNGSQHRCKLLLTTRRERACTLMGCEKNISLHLLSENEAWTLFNKHACINDITLQDVAREVAKECKGLPIALVAVGGCMKENDLDGINVVLHKLRHSKPIDVDEGEKDVFGCLRLSYDYLKNKESKLLFLLCAMFPEDHKIDPEDLFRYGIGLHVCRQADSFEIARSFVNDAINRLVESSLLMRDNDSNGDAFYRMHDMVRDVALWIASDEDRTIVVNHSTMQNSSFEDGGIKDCNALSCWKMSKNLPQQLDAPKLEMLLLNVEEAWNFKYSISLPSFEGFKEIKVMALMQQYLYMQPLLILPHSTHLLTNLRIMRLVGMRLDDISFVVSLRNLEILDFQKSILKELPNGLEKLNKLKLLDLSNCQIDGRCYEVIKRCLQLEELYVRRGLKNAYKDFDNFCIEDVTFSKLQRYQLEVGMTGSHFSKVRLCKKSLFIEGLNVSTSGANIKDLLRRANKVGLKMLRGGCKNVIPELVGGMNELIGLYLQSCSEIECVFNTTSLMASSFDVSIVVQSQLLIQELTIEGCSELKYIMTSGVCDNNRGKQIVAVPNNFYLCFSRLKKLHIHECYKLEYVFPMFVVQRLEQLEEIWIRNAPDVKYLFSELDHEYHSSNQNEIHIVLPRLKVIRFEGLLNLVKIFPESYQYQLSWPSLIEFYCEDCPKLTNGWAGSTFNKVNLEQRQSFLNKELEANETNGSKSSNEISGLSCVDFEGGATDLCFFPKIVNPIASTLTKLKLGDLPELRHIWMGSAQLLSLQCLEILIIYKCGKLKSLLSIEITSCEQIEEIKDSSTNKKKEIVLPNLTHLFLAELPSLVDICQGFTFRAVKLATFSIDECPMFAPFVRANQEFSIDKSKKGEAVVREGEVKHKIQADLQAILNVNEGEGAIVVPNLSLLILENMAEVEYIWKGPTLISFQHLRMLRVEECRKLRCIFSSAVITSLPLLYELNIKNCEELEEIISLSEEEANFPNPSSTTHHFQQPCFPRLQILQVEGCNRLRCVFPLSISLYHLPSLWELKIRRCCEVEQVFGYAPQNHHHHHDAEMMEFQLPKLHRLTLEELPSLTSFCRGFESHLNLEALRRCKVKDCPKFITSSQFGHIVGDTFDNNYDINNEDEDEDEEEGEVVRFLDDEDA